MRLPVLALTITMVAVTQLAAQDKKIASTTGSLTESVRGGGSRAASELRGRSEVRLPSRQRDGSQRGVGVNFDAQTEGNVSVGRNRTGVGASAGAELKAQRRSRRKETTPSEPSPQPENPESPEKTPTNRHVLHADLQLAHRLAEIDRLRDHALANDDVNLLMRADILEQQARVHHQRHVQQMQFAAEQGQGLKTGFWAEGQSEAHGDLPPPRVPAHDEQLDVAFDAQGASYEDTRPAEGSEPAWETEPRTEPQPEPPTRPQQRRVRERNEQIDSETEAEQEWDVELWESIRRSRPRRNLPPPRESRVRIEERSSAEWDLDPNGDGTVHAAEQPE